MKYIIQLFCLCLSVGVNAQEDYLHIGNNSKEESAIVQLDASDRGILVPRLTENERITFANPVEGILVFDLDSVSFWYFDGMVWVELEITTFKALQDGDRDTKISAEKIVGKNTLNFDVAGSEIMTVDSFAFIIEESVDFLIGSSSSGPGNKLFYDSSKKALRVGEVDGTEWDESQLGLNSFAFGKNNIASGYLSAATGRNTIASAINSTAFGFDNESSEENATSWGTSNEASGERSVAIGFNTSASAIAATSFGNSTNASGVGSLTFGFGTEASQFYSTAFGSLTHASGAESLTMGLNSDAKGSSSTAIGEHVVAESFAETAFGKYNTNYVANSKVAFDGADRLFSIGNGTSNSNRNDALNIRKDGYTISSGNIVNVTRSDLNYSNFRFLRDAFGDEVGFRFRHESDLFHIQSFTNNTIINAMSWDELGNLKIGDVPCCNSNRLSVAGTAIKPSPGAWLANSDRRLKKNIETISKTYALSQILKMQGVHYEWKEEESKIKRPKGIQDGFIAQELEELWPNKVSTDGQGYLQTAYGDYDPMFVESFKAQQVLIGELENEQEILKTEFLNQTQVNNEIKERLVKLKLETKKLLNEIDTVKCSQDNINNKTKIGHD